MPDQTNNPLFKLSLSDVQTAASEQLKATLVDLAQGAAADIHNYAYGIGRDMIAVQQEPDSEKKAAKLAELKGQLQSVGELNRLRLNNAAWAQFERVFDTAFGLVDRVLASAILAI